MTQPIAREFSPENKKKAFAQVRGMVVAWQGWDFWLAVDGWTQNVLIMQQCELNHLAAQVKETRRLLVVAHEEIKDCGSDYHHSQNSDIEYRLRKWLTANPVQKEGEL